MTPAVIDASVGIKWFLPEVYCGEACQWRKGKGDLHVPACLFDLEIANILWKKVGRDEITREEADFILAQLPLLPVSRHAEPTLLPPAFDLANRTQRTVYDCLYLALAVEIEGQMVTADKRLCNSLSGTTWAPFIRWVGDVPADA